MNEDDPKLVPADVYERAAERMRHPTPVDELIALDDLAREFGLEYELAAARAERGGSIDGEEFVRSLGFDDIVGEIAEIKRQRRETQ